MRSFVFPITTGRSGTAYLTELLRLNWPGAEVHHERTGYTVMGLDSPDASHFMLFNSVGNDARVQDFWRIKTARVLASPAPHYAEISHYLFKAGLVENLAPLTAEGEVHLILLTRDPGKIHWSYVNRFEFTNNGFTWLSALDWNYPNVLVKSAPFSAHGAIGNALWYVHEVFARMAYYALLTADDPRIHIHRVDLSEIITPEGAARLLTALGVEVGPDSLRMPPKTNDMKQTYFGADAKAFCDRLVAGAPMKSDEIAAQYFTAGRRLGDGPRQ